MNIIYKKKIILTLNFKEIKYFKGQRAISLINPFVQQLSQCQNQRTFLALSGDSRLQKLHLVLHALDCLLVLERLPSIDEGKTEDEDDEEEATKADAEHQSYFEQKTRLVAGLEDSDQFVG